MFKRVSILLTCTLGLVAATAHAQGAAQLKQYFDSIQSLRGEFVQSTTDEQGGLLEQSAGQLALQRPNRFRWSYDEPYEQEIVADGKRLWVYDIDLEQVTVRPLDDVLGFGPALLLSGDYRTLERTFDVRELGDGWLELLPRESEWDFQSVRLRMQEGVPQLIEVDSGFGQLTRLELSALERNPRLPADLFRFEAPQGVDVIAPNGLD